MGRPVGRGNWPAWTKRPVHENTERKIVNVLGLGLATYVCTASRSVLAVYLVLAESTSTLNKYLVYIKVTNARHTKR